MWVRAGSRMGSEHRCESGSHWGTWRGTVPRVGPGALSCLTRPSTKMSPTRLWKSLHLCGLHFVANASAQGHQVADTEARLPGS